MEGAGVKRQIGERRLAICEELVREFEHVCGGQNANRRRDEWGKEG